MMEEGGPNSDRKGLWAEGGPNSGQTDSWLEQGLNSGQTDSWLEQGPISGQTGYLAARTLTTAVAENLKPFHLPQENRHSALGQMVTDLRTE